MVQTRSKKLSGAGKCQNAAIIKNKESLQLPYKTQSPIPGDPPVKHRVCLKILGAHIWTEADYPNRPFTLNFHALTRSLVPKSRAAIFI
jgi:hypothetical protein